MRFAISLPQHFADGSFDAERFAAYCRRAEELGFESGWTGEQIIGTMPHLDPLDTLTFAAATTHRLTPWIQPAWPAGSRSRSS